MSEMAELGEELAVRSKVRDAWKYLSLAFAISWTCWIVVIKVHAPEIMLHIGSAGPALAALIGSRRMPLSIRRVSPSRVILFVVALGLGSLILSLYYAWRTDSTLNFQFSPWTLIPSALPALVISSGNSHDPGIKASGYSMGRFTWWSLIAILIFPGMILVGEVIAQWGHYLLILPQSHGSAGNAVAFGCLFFLYNCFFAAALEEPGWRGYLLPLLQQRWSPLRSTLLVWLAWALWHAPLDYFRPGGFSLVLYMQARVIFLIPIAVILTWVYNRSGRSVQACAIFHASMNTFPFVLPYWMPCFALLFVIAAFAIVSGRMWRKRSEGSVLSYGDGQHRTECTEA